MKKIFLLLFLIYSSNILLFGQQINCAYCDKVMTRGLPFYKKTSCSESEKYTYGSQKISRVHKKFETDPFNIFSIANRKGISDVYVLYEEIWREAVKERKNNDTWFKLWDDLCCSKICLINLIRSQNYVYRSSCDYNL